jgi:hypothetical protein
MSAPEPKRKAKKAAEKAVAMVLDPEYGERLQALVEHVPVWALNSTTNRAATEWLWEKDADTRSRITLFDVPDYPLDTQEFIGVVAGMVAQRGQHGETPLENLEVIGMELFPDLNGALLEFGFQSVESTVRGFKAVGLKRG